MNMKYIIVGAGISGLSIGQVLKEYGHDVQLFWQIRVQEGW